MRPSPPFSRRCVIKARFVNLGGNGRKAARLHLSYIERDGVERDGSKGRLFDAAGDVEREGFGSRIESERRQFRLIVSPEDGTELDLRQYTRQLMERVEKDLGQDLQWAAVVHYNTDNPHVHVVVRGVDRAGGQVLIPGRYLFQDMRGRAQEIATRELGPRTGLDMERQLTREVSRERYTSIDQRLAEIALPDCTIDMAALSSAEGLSRGHAVARLQFLERLDIADREGPGSWRLQEGWQDALKDLGERGDIIKNIHAAMRGDPLRYRVFDPNTASGPIEGIVRRKGLHNELADDVYAVVESTRGEAHYVRLDRFTAEEVNEGDIVRVEAKREGWAKGMDRAIQETAAWNGGNYDPALHLRSLGRHPIDVGGQTVAPEAVVEANCRRLERLERYNLVARMPGDTWRVPPNLVSTLEERERTHPRQRVNVERIPLRLEEQKAYRGRTWLDEPGQKERGMAFSGFGAEVREAARQRGANLKDMRIDATSPNAPRALDELERCTIGKREAAARGLAVDLHPERFRGHAVRMRAPSGREYALLVDESTRSMAIAAVPADLRGFEGRQLELAPGRDGRPTLRRRDLDLGR